MKELFCNKSFLLLSLYLVIAIFADFIANNQPIFYKNETGIYFPALSSNPYIKTSSNNQEKLIRKESIDWNTLEGKKIFPIINYLGNESSANKILLSPSLKRDHLLGTGRSGNDILAAIIHGCRTSLLLGIFSMLIAAFIGIFLGIISGYYGDNGISIKKKFIYLLPLTFIPAWFYGFTLNYQNILSAFYNGTINGTFVVFKCCVIFFCILLLPLFFISKKSGKSVNLPLKKYISILTEWFSSLPRLIIIITISAFIHPSVSTAVLIIGITSWPEIARTVSALVSSVKEREFIQSSKAMGLSDLRLILRHIFPNIIRSVSALLLFTVAAAIITEAGLSFLGLGLPAGTISWGQILAEGRENLDAWWLIVFPGIAITGLLAALQSLADIATAKKN